MSWIITHDILSPKDGPYGEDNVEGRGRGIEELRAVPQAERLTFRLLDDDLEHYFTGSASPDAYDDDDRPEGLYGVYRWAMGSFGVTHCCVKLDDAVNRLGMRPDIAEKIAFKSGPHKGWVTLYG